MSRRRLSKVLTRVISGAEARAGYDRVQQRKEGAKVVFDLATEHPNGVAYGFLVSEMRDLGYSHTEIVAALAHARAQGLVTMAANQVITVGF